MDEILRNAPIGIDHIAYATKDTDKTVEFLQSFGFEIKVYKRSFEKHKAYVTKLINKNGDIVEIVEPQQFPSIYDAILGDNETAVYHICFKVEDFAHTYEIMRRAGAIPLSKPFDSIFCEGYLVSHMFHPNFGIFEIFGEKKANLSVEDTSK